LRRIARDGAAESRAAAIGSLIMSSARVFRGYVIAAAAGVSLALLLPAQAQFWGDWGGRPQRQQQYNNNWGGWGGGWNDRRYDDRRYYDPYRQERQEREAPVDYSRAPAPSQKKPEATTPIVVMGDANADWLAYGLEDAFSENPEVGIVRKHRTDSGLIRYDQRRDLEWPQVAREIIAAEKPKFIVMMIGNNDRQTIREKAPPAVARPAAPKPNTQAAQPSPPAATPPIPAPPLPTPPPDAEQQPPAPAEAAEHANMTPEQARQASYGPWEFHTEKWELAYIRRIDATIAALKSAGVPVMWVGLPSQRGTKASADSSYLNELYRSRAEKAGIVYVDIWDGFVDEAGRYSQQGPDYEGQIRRLRSGDGVYYTKFGARKLAHYVEREIQRSITNRGMPVALPVPADPGPQAPNAKPGGPAQRPLSGPVVPLTAMQSGPEELVGGGRAAPAVDATVSRVLTKGEPVAAPGGRADDFSWPRGSALNFQPAAADPAAAPAPTATAPDAPDAKPAKPAAGQRTSDSSEANSTSEQKPARRPRPRSNPGNAQRSPFFFQNFFR
jgi:hypothetical protein